VSCVALAQLIVIEGFVEYFDSTVDESEVLFEMC
jgi:hypothetical protein